MKIAILGANGFVGGRAVEMFHLGGIAEVRPVVRSFARLARLARFELDWQIADARDAGALTAAFAGCEVVVHAVVGDAQVIADTIDPVYAAAQAVGARRLIYLSTASVHGLAPAPGTDETSALSDRQAVAYCNAKVRAERRWRELRRGGRTELVMLRPGIVFGPRSRWVTDVAGQLLNGTAWFVNEGAGVCNSIYVDNLVEAIRRAMTATAGDGEALLVGDAEPVTWADFYRPMARALGCDLADIARVAPPPFHRGWRDNVKQLHATKMAQSLLPWFPARLKRSVKAVLADWHAGPAPSPWTATGEPQPVVTQEMAMLQQCQWRLSSARAERVIGYRPTVAFAEGMQRSIGWLGFAGYPVTP